MFASLTTSCFMAMCLVLAHGQDVNDRHSFMPEFSGDAVPFWKNSPAIRIDPDRLRLTPYSNIKSGYLWNNVRSLMVSWEVTFKIKISNLVPANDNARGEGLAFWYAESAGIAGHVFGSTDYWIGLGLFFEPFSINNTQQEVSRYLKITANLNDGSHAYSANSVGSGDAPNQRTGNNQDASLVKSHASGFLKDDTLSVPQVGSCYRTMPRYPSPDAISVRVKYVGKSLSVTFLEQGQEQECFAAEQVAKS